MGDQEVKEEVERMMKTTRFVSKGLRSQLEDFPMGPRWDRLSMDKNNCNRFKQVSS